MLGLRFLLALLGANSEAGFAQFVRGVSDPFFAPFRGIVGSPSLGGDGTLALPIIVALVAYAVLHMAINRALRMVVGGRYLDRLVRTADGWRIAHRRYVMDWNETEPSTMDADGRFARFTARGARWPDDASYD